MIGKYESLRNVLEVIRKSAPDKYKKYHPESNDIEKLNQAYARVYIHLYLKVKFGMLDFEQREKFITDGGMDGGVDAYFVDNKSNTIYLIQSKFRTNETNFESKKIDINEILAMDIERILEGEKENEDGTKYNGKIYQLQREISEIPDIGRYAYKVVLLANIDKRISLLKLKRLSSGLPVSIVNHESAYNELLFPVISGTYYNASDLTINVKLTDKSSGSKINYTVKTEFSACDITVLFVPTIEIGRIMNEYKNSILKYNPRSYLEIQGRNVNSEIRSTLIDNVTNEFALFNNGITMLSDETYLNEKIGQREKAQLLVKNPQVINGGQTAYTLSRIYHEYANDLSIFQDKEVLLKVITIHDEEISEENKSNFIQAISRATNLQSVVTNADRKANDNYEIWLQNMLFEKVGIFYERKRGQYNDGIMNGYIKRSEVLTRPVFVRLMYAAKGNMAKATATRKKGVNVIFAEDLFEDESVMNRLKFLFVLFSQHIEDNASDMTRKKIGTIIKRLSLMLDLVKDNEGRYDMQNLSSLWKKFMAYVESLPENNKYYKTVGNKRTGEGFTYFHFYQYLNSGKVRENMHAFNSLE